MRTVEMLSVAVAMVCMCGLVSGNGEYSSPVAGRADDVAAASPTTLVWPKPSSQTTSAQQFSLTQSAFKFSTHSTSVLLSSAFTRYTSIFFNNPSGMQLAADPDASGLTAITTLTVSVASSDETLGPNTNETYALDIAAPTSTLSAQTVYGAIRGLETMSQLIQIQSGVFVINATVITDSPRYGHRSYLIDSARHFLPVSVIKQHLDAMAYNKMNILHWHMTDDQSFPYQSRTFPQLSAQGAYSASHTYSSADVAGVIAYAKARGIRVIVEFDTPGHTYSWGYGIPALLTQCYDDSGNPNGFGPINPLLNSTWATLKAFFSEVALVFSDSYLHLGGDEVDFTCWQSNPQIVAWMEAQNSTNYAEVEQYYMTHLTQMVTSLGKSFVVWQDVFDNGVELPSATVINVWRNDLYQSELAVITNAGYQVVLSAPWYLNYISYGNDWTQYYAVDPSNFTGTSEQKALVIGGEVCMWGEYVDATNSVARTWPRASAIAERLWSPETVTDIDDATLRLSIHTCRMIARGIPAEPPSGPGFCTTEFEPAYTPPFHSDL